VNHSRSGEAPGAFVSCPGLTDDVFRQVLRELAGARGEPARMHRALQVFRDHAGYRASWHDVLWRVARHRLVGVEDNEPLLDALAEGAATDPRSSPDIAAIVAELLERLPDGRDHGLPGGWTQAVDDLVFAAYRHEPAPFMARRAGYSPRVRCALDFVRGRAGSRLADDERAQVLAMLLEHAGSAGLTAFGHVRTVDDDDAEDERQLTTADDVRAVATRFGSGEAWDAGLLVELRRDRWRRFADVRPLLARLPLAEFVSMLLPRRESAVFVNALLSERADGDDELRAAAEALPDDRDGAWLRHCLAEVVAARTTPPREVCTVVLVAVGEQRLRLVKLLATQTPIGVAGARAAVEALPAELAGPMPVAEATALAASVEALGGKLELRAFRTVPGHVIRDPPPLA
jgi:ribosomal protein L7/L12